MPVASEASSMIGIVSSNRPSSKILRRPRKGAPVDVAGGWNALRVDVMRWILRMKREANATEIVAVLAATGARPIVEISTRDPQVGHAARRRPLRGQERPRPAVDGTSPAASRPRPGGTIRRLARPHPRRPYGRPHRRSRHRSRGRLTAAAPSTRCPRGFLHSDPKGSSRAAGGIAAEGCPEGVRAAPFPRHSEHAHDPSRAVPWRRPGH